MEAIIGVIEFVRALPTGDIWAQVLVIVAAVGALLKGIEAILSIIAPLTPWQWDNDIADLLGKAVAHKIFRKK